jgi:integration host factor subunit alpha
MTKAEIVQAVLDEVGGFSKREAAQLVDAVFLTIKDRLARGESVKISGFGNFTLRDKSSRMGRNPRTGEPIEITPRRVLTFRPSQVLRETLNGAGDGGEP